MSWVDGVRYRLHRLLRPAAFADEQSEERRFHREMEALEGQRSTGPRRPPDPELPLLGSSVTAFLDGLRQDLRYALRGLARSPGFTFVAVATLSLGVGANGAVFSVVDRLFGQPPAGVADPDGLRRLYVEFPNHPFQPGRVVPSFSYAAYAAVDGGVAGTGEAAAWAPPSERPIRIDALEVTARATWVTQDFFSVLGVSAARGRVFGPDEVGVANPTPVAVVSHAFWERTLGLDPEVVGRTLQYNETTFTIVGVTPEGFSGIDLGYTDVFLPLNTFPAAPSRGTPWYETTGNYLRVIVRLPDGGEDGPLSEAATAAYHAQEPAPTSFQAEAVVLAGPIIEARGPGREAGTVERGTALTISTRTMGVTLMVLLIACANVAGLLLVRASRRRREIAVRLAVGVSRGRLASQLLAEGLVLSVAAGGVGIGVATWGGGLLRRALLPEIQWATTEVDMRTLWFASASAVAVGLVAAVAPALQSRKVDVASALKAGARGGGSARAPLRTGLLVVQAALSIVLLVGAALFVRSLSNVTALRLGFDQEEVAYLRIPLQRLHLVEEEGVLVDIAARLGATPGVSQVALASFPPLMGASSTRIFILDAEGEMAPAGSPGASSNAVSPKFFEVAGVRIVEGRAFVDGDADVVIVDETMATTYWPGRSPLGSCLVVGMTPDGPCRTVIGIAEDQHDMRIIEDPAPKYFVPGEDELFMSIVMRVSPRAWGEVAEEVRAVAGLYLDPQTVDIDRLSNRLEPQYRPWRLGTRLFGVFGLLALLVTGVGVYGVMAYAVSERTHEMGVRIALGAELADLLRLVLGEGLRVVVLGCVVGIAASLALGRMIEALLYGVTPRDPVAALTAAAVLLSAGLAASLLPALRAGRVDPAEVLRQE